MWRSGATSRLCPWVGPVPHWICCGRRQSVREVCTTWRRPEPQFRRDGEVAVFRGCRVHTCQRLGALMHRMGANQRDGISVLAEKRECREQVDARLDEAWMNGIIGSGEC